MSALFRLNFLLPARLARVVQPGRHHPCLHACMVTIGRNCVVVIEGPSRERVFEQASRFFRAVGKGLPQMSIGAWLTSPCGGRDGWSIIVGADVAFAPCSLPPYLAEKFETENPPTPALTILAAG